MKKVVLFAASMMLCAGLAFAQTPKKPAQNQQAAKTTATDKVKTTDQKTTAPTEKPACGKCPHSKQCDSQKIATDKQSTPKFSVAPKKQMNDASKEDSKSTPAAKTTK